MTWRVFTGTFSKGPSNGNGKKQLITKEPEIGRSDVYLNLYYRGL